MASSKMDHHYQQQRTLCSTGSTVPQHNCFDPEEKDVISPNPPTPAPSISPPPTSFRSDADNCVADGQGNYGTINGPSSHVVEYRYQVETTDAWTAFQLNMEVLQDVEKAISDRMVQRYFLEQCSPPVIDIFGAENGITLTSNAATAPPFMILGPQQQRVANPFPGEEGGLRKLMLLQSKNKRLRRHLKSEDHQELIGLSADPIDQVLEGDEGGTSDHYLLPGSDVQACSIYYAHLRFCVKTRFHPTIRRMSLSHDQWTLLCRGWWSYCVWGRSRGD